MTLDIVTKGIPFLHMAIMSIPLTEEEFYLKFPSLWRYRHLFGLGICFMISQSV